MAPGELEGVRAALRRWADEDAGRSEGGLLRVAVHIITAGGEGDVPDDRITRLMSELDRDFAGTGYRFELASLDRTDDAGWYRMSPGSGAERRAKLALAVEPARRLNLYVCSPASGVAGWASYPWVAPEGHYAQGVVVDRAALADEPSPGTVWGVAHQVGHFLGLIDAEAGGESAAPGFSAVETARMHAVVPLYRPSLFSAPAPRGGTTGEISPTEGAEPEDGRVLSYRGPFPNPFRAETMLRFTLPSRQPVSLRIYSVTGQLVRTLVDAALPPGDHSAMFRADGLPSGAYFAVLWAGGVRMSRTLMLVR